ncbi:protein kinase [candidate division KSB1 bacterium]|nr:protein kinase [candidate division KSB1 bacterium]
MMIPIGSKISHYQIIELLGQGGMGEVYLAEDLNLRRRAALKVLAPKYTADPSFQERFKREAQAAANLNHPNIVTIYEIGEYEGRSFIAMEYVPGESLRGRLISEKLPVRQVIDFVLQICDGMAAAHRAGIVHRDLKPANILIDADDKVKIVDFGLAKVQGVSKLTKSGIMMGTLPYMSPEQVRGEELDRRSDIFSMGVVLYELLTRDLPFQGETEFVMMSAIVGQEPRPLSVYDLDLPQGLQDIINTALAKDLRKRYQQIEELAAALKNVEVTETTFKNYRLLKKLGAGGMGEVYLAEDMELGRKVALKFLSEQYTANPEFKARFKREAQLAAKLNHPNIVTIYEVGEHQHRSYIAMEYVEGEALKDRIARAKLPLKEALDLMAQICAGISKAHRAGITHRDIKPANILINLDGQAKILDFGLAKMQGVSGLTKSGAMMGTLSYMSPEQVKGEEIDSRSDIFSTGVILYELLTGELPFKGNTEFTVMSAIATQEPPALARYKLGIPAALQNCIDKALAKDRQARYQHINELQADLKRAMGLPSDLPPSGPRDSTETVAIYKKKMTLLTSRMARVWSAVLALLALASALIFVMRQGKVSKSVPASKSAPASAWLSVTTQPDGATIFLNDDSLGVTPLNVPLAQEGRIKLSFRKRNYLAVDTSLVIQKGQTYELSPSLAPAARVAIFVEPPDAEVRIDETLIAASRLANLQLPAGGHQISISRPGYDSKQEQFSLQPGDNDPRRYALAKQIGGELLGGAQIESQPPGALVTLDGKSAGSTPYRNSNLSPGRHQLVLRLEGYENYSTTIVVSAGKITPVTAPLKKAAAVSQLSVNSTPDGATLLLDGQEIGTTPYQSNNVAVGAHQIVLRKTGYRDYSASVTVSPQQPSAVEAKLVLQLGALRVLVKPYGSIYVDGILQKTDTNVLFTMNLPAGSHKLKAIHPSYGAYEKTVNIEADVPFDMTIDFNRKLTVTVTSADESDQFVWGHIYVDGDSTGYTTQKQLTLRLGAHVIEVKRKGYISLDGPLSILLEGDVTKPLKFRLKKL